MIKYQLRNKIYTVADCLEKEIPSHIERVSSYWQQSDTDTNSQIGYMKDSIANGIAIKCLDDKNKEIATTYGTYYKNSIHLVFGHLLWANSNRALALFIHYGKFIKNVARIFFMPHSMHPVPFEDIVELHSIRLYHKNKATLEINLQTGKAV